MMIESLYYEVVIRSDDEYTVKATAFMSDGSDITSVVSAYEGSPYSYIEGLELGDEDELVVIDERT